MHSLCPSVYRLSARETATEPEQYEVLFKFYFTLSFTVTPHVGAALHINNFTAQLAIFSQFNALHMNVCYAVLLGNEVKVLRYK